MKRLDLAIEAAQNAGSAIRTNNRTDLNIQEKDSSRTSIVTAADLRSQQEIIRTIRRAFPRDLIVGEEGSDGRSTSPSRWYVDPLDGTTNYAHGLHFTAYRLRIAMKTASPPASYTSRCATKCSRPFGTAARCSTAPRSRFPRIRNCAPAFCRHRFSPMMRRYWSVMRAVSARFLESRELYGPWARQPWRLPMWRADGSTRFSKPM
jgi:hypothetical protein